MEDYREYEIVAVPLGSYCVAEAGDDCEGREEVFGAAVPGWGVEVF